MRSCYCTKSFEYGALVVFLNLLEEAKLHNQAPCGSNTPQNLNQMLGIRIKTATVRREPH